MMQEKLIIVWPMGDDLSPSWACVNAVGGVTKQIIHGEAVMLAADAVDREVIVLVPSVNVLCLQVTLPKLSRSAMRDAIGYALEDQLADECDQLHFVPAKIASNTPIDVAVVAKRDMQNWLDQCAAWSIKPDVFLPSALALPHTPGEWQVMAGEQVLARLGETCWFAGDTANLSTLITSALKEHAAPSVIQLTRLSSSTVSLSLSVPVIETLVSPAAESDRLIREASVSLPLNLLQGEYQVKKSHRQWSSGLHHRWIKRGVMAWVGLLLLYPLVSWWMLATSDAALQSEMKNIYHRQFPSASMMVAPRERLAEKLRQNGQGASGHHFFVILAEIGRAMGTVGGVQLKRLDYNGREFTLQVSAQSSSIFSSWTEALSGEGLRVKQQNAELSGERVNATIIVE